MINNPAISKEESIDKNGLLLLIDKPKDYSSARVVNIIKKKLNVRKAGHSGTLDPKASGLLIVCTDRQTKKLSNLLESDKEYEGIMILGEITKSFDAEMKVIEKKPIDNINREKILETAKFFRGEVEQLPPMFSAVKYKGKPLYKYAREDKDVLRKTRKVFIKEFEIKGILKPEVHFRIVCSKGTYIRTLVNDFGRKLGVGAYLKELRRLKIGTYDVKDSIKLEEISAEAGVDESI
ncbi:MAG: tRNA pseudouridine(55) synthase TruB [Ignavibacteria bacterium]